MVEMDEIFMQEATAPENEVFIQESENKNNLISAIKIP